MKEIFKKLKKLYLTGFFHIFFTTVVNKILSFCSSIFIVKILSKENFGIYSYSQNLLSLFLLLDGLGIGSGLLQFATKAKTENERVEIFSYSLKKGIIINTLITLSIIIYCKFGIFKIEEGRKYLFYMSGFSIFVIIIELFLFFYRAELKNKEMSELSCVNTVATIICMIVGGKVSGLTGVIIGKYLGYIVTIIALIKYTPIEKMKIYLRNNNISKKMKKNIINYSLIALINNSIISLIHMIDIFSIGYLLGNKSTIAAYKTANIIPFGLEFIPAAIMIYIYPFFVKNNEDYLWIKKNYIKILKIFMSLNIFIVLSANFFAKDIIFIIFGREYSDSIPIFKILCVGYFFTGSFRVLGANVLFALGKPKFNVYSSLVAGITNIILNIFLIEKYGSIGAAYSTLLIFIIWGILVNFFIYKTLRYK